MGVGAISLDCHGRKKWGGGQGTLSFLHSRRPSESVSQSPASVRKLRFAVYPARKLGMPDHPLTCIHSLILIAKAINRKWKMDRCDAAGSSLPPRRRQSTLSRTDLNSWQAGDDSDSGAQCSVDDRRPVTSPRPPRILVRSSPSFLSACAALSPRSHDG